MPTYILQPGNHVIHYPESCVEQPASLDDFSRFMDEMDSAFHCLLGFAHDRFPHDRFPDDHIVEAFHRFMLADSPMFQIPYWQTWKLGPGKWPYGKWALDKLRYFIGDRRKLIDALADLERAKELERLSAHPPHEVIILNFSEDEPQDPVREISI